jgi:hypothetical protein
MISLNWWEESFASVWIDLLIKIVHVALFLPKVGKVSSSERKRRKFFQEFFTLKNNKKVYNER